MKRLVHLILLLIFINSLFATSLSEQEINYALTCVKDVVFVSCDYFISESQPQIPNLKVRIPKNSGISDAIVFDNCDMATLLQYFPQKNINSNNIIESLKEPLAIYVRDSLINNDWKASDAVVLGAVALAFKDNESINQVVSNLVDGIYPRVGVVTDLTISGGLFSYPLNVKGVFVLEEIDDTLGVNPMQMSINGEEIDVFQY